ncbi:hypothetical protein BO94DRAFT_590608 [Aspergillus sclerotioniger CBS 115572]|uniref:Zn(2)-C6 fungal-type domain-containing protein n=1 Tax=Aspergillus sclerotioniger CBS 115572 TaxID=1450535 RepID=A0A317V678_9EURO|nr:hypothetical protein BO94DRAFT_590608 [Aspergillus sclerotioniger CBS 115572]PWY69029.1 hypothetical protein BO94DRAFT_590608 [Aspergillus sclerotioniger CBS 115572]
MAKQSNRKSGPPELRACAECRKRKSKCSGAAPCSYCSRTKKRCRFDRVPSRTPLTRKNLDEKERLCANLVALIHRLNPNVDIGEAVKTLSASDEGSNDNEPGPALPSLDPTRGSPTPSGNFEWNETPSSSTHLPDRSLDGMASLPTGRSESGYLGNSSGSCILKTISDLLPEHTTPQAARRERLPADLHHIESPSLSAELGNTALLDRLIDAYFVCYNSSFPILHEWIFRQKYRNRDHIPDGSTWHMIFYLVLAIGDWTLSGGSKVEQSKYYMAARSRMSIHLLESGSLLTVQAFLLMGNFLQKRDRPNTGYNFIGIAYRMALGLGLHREPPIETTGDTLANERRRAVWWILYSFDSGFSLTTGRPLMSSDCFIETRLPQNIEDSGCRLDSTLPDAVDIPTTYSAIIALARLARTGNMVYLNVIAAPKKDLNLKVSRSLDHQLKAWRLSLPVYFTAHDVPTWFRGPRAVVGWKEQNLRMMLWWGTHRLCISPSDTEEAQNMCHYAAIECIQDITTFCIDYPDTLHNGLTWYATYFLFQASVVLSIHYLRPHQPLDTNLAAANQELWLFSISRARDCLANLSQANQAAARCLEVLDRIRDQSQATPTPGAEASAMYDADAAQLPTIHDAAGMRQAMLPVDPSLQMFFDATSWNKDIFEGLQGFPITDEVESFDYVSGTAFAADIAEDWAMPMDPSLEAS